MTKKVIKVGDFKLGNEEKKAINEVLDSGRLSEGQKVNNFESNWSKFVGTKYSVATSSGSGALITALTALKYKYNLPDGTKVITSPLTYIADVSSISAVKFKPVFVDVDLHNFCITPDNIRDHLKRASDIKKYGIILPVDLMGYPVDISEINKIAREYNLLVLEDAAQAHGSSLNGAMCGSQALLSTFSFYIAHNIQAGEMGAINTNDLKLMRLCKQIKAQGRACDCFICTRAKGICPGRDKFNDDPNDLDPRFTHEYIGYNFKTMEFQAALALTQLDHIKSIISRRQRNVFYLNEKLVRYQEILQLPIFSKNISYLAYPIIIKDNKIITRKKLRENLENLGVETRPLFGCIPTQQPAYKELKQTYQGKLPNADYLGANGLYIGCHQYLTKDDLDFIVEAFTKILD